jgi:protein-L-isoaspartate(D-aspartate) O-methyltransferase
MDSAVQRKNMVDSQVRPSDVTDRRVPRAMLEVPREEFVPSGRRAVAYMDGDLAVTQAGGRGQRKLIAPRTLAKLLQALELGDEATVLDVGAATGYSAALLAHFAKHVVAVEEDRSLAERAKETFASLGIKNISVETAPLTQGAPSRGPYDAILVEGKVSDVPSELLDQLKDGGVLVAIVDQSGVGMAMQWRRFGMSCDRHALFNAEAPMLPGFQIQSGFVL